MKDVKVDKNSYIINGKSYPRVTSILNIIGKPWLLNWYGKHGVAKCKSIIDDRAAFGSRVHKEIENYVNSEEILVDNEEMRKSLFLFRDWYLSHYCERVDSEFNVFSDKFDYAGTVDWRGNLLVDGKTKRAIIDWKTSKSLSDTNELQIAAYLFAYEEVSGDILDGAGLLLIRDGRTRFKYFYHSELEDLFNAFLHARELYRWRYKK